MRQVSISLRERITTDIDVSQLFLSSVLYAIFCANQFKELRRKISRNIPKTRFSHIFTLRSASNVF